MYSSVLTYGVILICYNGPQADKLARQTTLRQTIYSIHSWHEDAYFFG